MTHGTQRRLVPDVTLIERLWRDIRREGSCWVWHGYRNKDGYGEVTHKSVQYRVHRLMYQLLVEPVAQYDHVDHLCRNRACCNPAHLDPCSPRENALRSPVSVAATNAAKTHCPNGHPYDVDYGSRRCRQCTNARRESWRTERRRRGLPV